jgi:hypothetical protein
MNPLLELHLEVLNWVKIWTIEWLIHHWYTLILKPLLDLFGCIDIGIILHKCYTRFLYPRHLIIKNCEIRVGSVS